MTEWSRPFLGDVIRNGQDELGIVTDCWDSGGENRPEDCGGLVYWGEPGKGRWEWFSAIKVLLVAKAPHPVPKGASWVGR
jgi:hypothetical protein